MCAIQLGRAHVWIRRILGKDARAARASEEALSRRVARNPEPANTAEPASSSANEEFVGGLNFFAH
jgi:hypothetical protein